MSLLDTASLILTPNGYKGGVTTGKLYSVKPTNGDGDMVVTRNTTATRVNSAGLIESVDINVPRLDYTGGGCPRILVEPERINRVLYSEQFDNAYWVKTLGGVASAPVVTPNVETAPDGTTTADRVVFNLNGGTASGDFSQLESAIFTSISITRTQSVYIKTTDGTTKIFSFVSPTGTLTTITVTSVYQRFTFTSTGINVSSVRLRLRGSASGEGTATSATIAIWGAQYEDGSNATSYIPTVAGTVTRVADVISKTGISSLIGQTEGTLYAEINITTFNNGVFFSINDGTSGNRIQMYKFTDNKIYCDRISATQSVTTSINSSALSVGTYKVAFAYQSGNSYLYINGAPVGATSAATFTFGSMGKVNIGSRFDDTSTFNDRIKSAILFPTRLSPGQLQTLTA